VYDTYVHIVYVTEEIVSESFQQEGRTAVKEKITRTSLHERLTDQTDWKRLREMRDEDIDFSDIPLLDESFWKEAKVVPPERKQRLTIRLDHDLVEWLKKDGAGYQTRINAILRSYMNAQSEARR
jgi:uncharacterized protein (DUF4415 family)